VTATPQMAALNGKSLAAFPPLFATLAPPALDALPGFYRGEFVGPSWLRAIAPRGLGLIHLGGWWGKELAADCTGANLVRTGPRQGGILRRSFPLVITTGSSAVDGRPVVAVRYPPECPFPWPHVIDELRRLDDACILGMTIVPAGLLRRLPLPFLLIRTERPHGL
jgi:hypothetical protein